MNTTLSRTDKLLKVCDLMQAAIAEALKADMDIRKFQSLIDKSRKLLDEADGTEKATNAS